MTQELHRQPTGSSGTSRNRRVLILIFLYVNCRILMWQENRQENQNFTVWKIIYEKQKASYHKFHYHLFNGD